MRPGQCLRGRTATRLVAPDSRLVRRHAAAEGTDGAALTREKIVAAQSRLFVCIADESKRVGQLGAFPLPVEVIPMAARHIARQFEALGGTATLRHKDGAPLVTDNGQHILDVTGLQIGDPLAFEDMVNNWPGVVTVGVFAFQKADVCLLGTRDGVRTLEY